MAEIMLSAVVACYKDALAIPSLHRRLTSAFTSLPVAYEIIFVNDGSPDSTDLILQDLTASDDHVLAIEHSRNFGSQNAFVSGMQIAKGDAVILLDGDLQDPPELIPAFFESWQLGYEVVYGRRSKREGSAVLTLFCKAFYRIFRRVSAVPMPLHAGDFALMDRRVVDQLLALPETDQFLRGLRAWVGFRQAGVEYLRPKRPFGRSNNGWLKNLWWAKKGIFSFTFLPIELMGYAGATLTGLAFLAGVYQVIDALENPERPHGLAAIAICISFFGGLNLLAVSVLGEYLIKIFEETKRRPKFIRRALRHGGLHFDTVAKMDAFLKRRARKATSQPSQVVRLFDRDER